MFSANTTTVSSGNWNNASNWSNGVPGNNDNAIINHTITLNQNDRLKNITINGTLINGGYQLRVDGDWIKNGTYTDTSGEVLFRNNTNHQLTGNTKFFNLTLQMNKTVFVNDSIWVRNDLDIKNGILDVTSGMLTIVGDSIYTGRLVGIGNNDNIIGSFIFEQWVDRCNNWSLYGGPFDATLNEYADSATGQMIYTNFPNSDYPTFGWTNTWLWDENWNTPAQGWVTPNGNVTLARGTGFWYWNSDTVFNSSGPPIQQKWKVATKGTIDFTSTFSFPIQYTNTGDITSDGWNLVSNPYPGVIDWDDIGWVRTNVDNAIYEFNTCNQTYSSYVGSIGVNGGDRYISTFQGFYIKTNNTSPSLTSKSRVITSNPTTLLKSSNPLDNILRVSLGDDEIIIRANDLTNSSFNSDFDAYKFMGDGSRIYSKFYTDTVMYSINSINDSTSSIPVYTIGSGTLYFNDLVTWEPHYDLYLEDLSDNSMTQISTLTTGYPFIGSNINYTNRFIIHLFAGSSVNVAEINNDDSIKVLYDNDQIIIKSNQSETVNVVIYNMLGQVILSDSNVNIKSGYRVNRPGQISIIRIFNNDIDKSIKIY